MYFFLNGEQPTFSTTLTRWPLAISAHSSTHSSIHPHIHSSGALWFLNLHLSGGIEPQPSVVRRPELLQITHTHTHTYTQIQREIHAHTNTDTERYTHIQTQIQRDTLTYKHRYRERYTHTHTHRLFLFCPKFKIEDWSLNK